MKRILAFAAGLLAAAPLGAQQSHLLVVSGLPGEPRFAQSFAAWSAELATAARTRYGLPAANVAVLSDGGTGAARSTRDNVLAAIRAIGARAGAQDEVVIVLFGHGSESGGEARFNLGGPDITARELAAALDALAVRRVTVINTASASGAFLKPLARTGRVIMTATKSGAEQNETLFPRYLVAALTGDGADTDKDARVSMQEAFDYAKREVERAYASTQRLQTEHPVLETGGDAAAAKLAFFGGAVPRAASASAPPAAVTPELRSLYEEKARLESAIESLRSRKAQLPEAEYEQELERLLLELSRNGQAIRRAGGGAP